MVPIQRLSAPLCHLLGKTMLREHYSLSEISVLKTLPKGSFRRVRKMDVIYAMRAKISK